MSDMENNVDTKNISKNIISFLWSIQCKAPVIRFYKLKIVFRGLL